MVAPASAAMFWRSASLVLELIVIGLEGGDTAGVFGVPGGMDPELDGTACGVWAVGHCGKVPGRLTGLG